MLEGQDDIRVGVEKTPDLDEGWWSAVLADEVDHEDQDQDSTVHEVAPVTPVVSPADVSSEGEVDWLRIQEVYDRDEVIVLVVQSYNRGGLLVQGPGVQGFVPISHLVDMPGGINEEERFQKLTAYVNR
jgi:ribosomal protein S1